MSEPEPAAESNSDTPLARLLSRAWVAALLYLFLTLVMTFPLVIRFRSWVPFGTVDLWQNYWNFWWWKKCLLELHQHPYTTQFLFFPSGASLVFYTHSPFNMLVSLPVNALFGPAAAYNFCVVLGLWLSSLSAYLLLRELGADSRGAFLGGLIFTFFPQHIEQTLEHLNLFSVEFIPLAMLFMLRLARPSGRLAAPNVDAASRRVPGSTTFDWLSIVGLGLCYAANALIDWHLGILLSLALIPLAITLAIKHERPAALFTRDLALAGALAALIVLPGVWPLLRGMINGETFFQKPPEDKGIDPAFLFVPSDHHPLFGALTFGFYEAHRAYRAAGFLCYLGFVPVALAVFALIRRARGAAFWWGLLTASLLLSFGAKLYWVGHAVEGLPLPFSLYARLPVFGLMRIANRFLILTSLALALLAGLGWSALRHKPDWKFALLAALVLFEYLWLPYPMQKVELSPYYAQLAASGAAAATTPGTTPGITPSAQTDKFQPGAVLDIPFTSDGKTVLNMVAQTVHNRKIAGGYLSTRPPEALQAIETDPMLSQLQGIEPKFTGPLDRAHLVDLGFGVAIFHKDRMESEWKTRLSAAAPRDTFTRKSLEHHVPMSDAKFAELREAFTAACGLPIYEDETIIVFDLKRLSH